jgi:cyanophycin synthetase
MDGEPKVGIISGTGDRRDEDIKELGRISGKIILMRSSSGRIKTCRGRTAEEIVNLTGRRNQ